jgi:heavy metal translocating P-type ATPase
VTGDSAHASALPPRVSSVQTDREAPTARRQCAFCELPLPAAAGDEPDVDCAELAADNRRTAGGPIYCCYGCRLAADITLQKGDAGWSTLMLTRLGVGVFLSMNVMMFAMALYAADVYAGDPALATPLAASLTGVLRYLSLLMATPVLVLLGWPLWRNAIAQARDGVASLDALVVLGVGASFLYSYWSTLADRGAIYYESACAVLVFVTLGRWFEASGKVKAAAEMRALERLLPREVTVERDGATTTLPVDELRVGDLLLVAAGQRCAADGVVATGRGHVNDQVLTGESAPIVKEAGDSVSAGSLSLDGTLAVRVSAVGRDDALGRLLTWMDEARAAKGRHERLADRVARYVVPATIALAIVGASWGLERGGLEEAMMTALAVMLIACPCALGIATPLAVWVSLGRAAREGVLFRTGDALEALAQVNAVCFDKTGTLTTGVPAVSAFVAADDSSAADEPAETDGPASSAAGQARPDGAVGDTLTRVLGVAAGLVRGVTHPLSRSVMQCADGKRVAPAPVADVTVVAGRGLEGVWNGEPVYLGSSTLMDERGVTFSTAMAAARDQALASRAPVACIGWDGVVRGVFVFAETVRDEAPRAIARLESLGCGVAMLTGDHAQRADDLAASLGVHSAAELSPGDKLRTLDVLRAEHGAVAMVGDGINDAPALARADVGIALGCGTDLAREAADVCLLGNDLTRVPWAIALARRTVRTMKQNLFWACVYNGIGVPLAMSGHLSPAFAALAMVLSSALVVSNSLVLARIDLETPV